MKPPQIDWDRLGELIESHRGEKWGLIPLLQEIQALAGYIPPESIEPIAEAMGLFASEVRGVITFYAGFSLEPRGRYVLRVCCGTACHVKGGRGIYRLVKRHLGIEEGGTTEDYRFTLESAACLGACALAPTMMVNRDYFGKLSPLKVGSILDYYGKQEE
jgi:NADH:ubiquinone oxidoreductase subunit E